MFMENALALAAVMGPAFCVMGLSVLLYANQWKKLMAQWKKGHFGIFAMMLMTLILGLIVINMYNVWEWNLWLIVTITGWAMFIKGLFYFLLPADTIKAWMAIGENKGLLYVGALIWLVAGVALTYNVYFL